MASDSPSFTYRSVRGAAGNGGSYRHGLFPERPGGCFTSRTLDSLPFPVARVTFTAEKPTSRTEISNYNEHITHRLTHLGTGRSMTAKPPPDAALLDLFRAELETHLGALNEGLLSLEKSPNDAKRLESLMRAAHSIKGAAKVVGFDAAVQVSHHLEDCFVAAQRGQLTLTSDSVDVLLRGVDALNRLGSTAASASEESGLTRDRSGATDRRDRCRSCRSAAGIQADRTPRRRRPRRRGSRRNSVAVTAGGSSGRRLAPGRCGTR